MQGYFHDTFKIVVGHLLTATSSALNSQYVSLKGYHHCAILIATKVSIGAETSAITLTQATAVAGTGAKALAFTKAFVDPITTTASLLTETAVTSNSHPTTANASVQLHCIEVPADSLDVANGFDCLRVNMADPGSETLVDAIFFILGPARYKGPPAAFVEALSD